MKKIFLTVLAAAAVCACSNKEQIPESVNSAAGTAIRFTTNIYTLKSSDTSLDANDQVGIFAGDPINRANVKGVVAAGGSLTVENTIYWAKDQTKHTDFIAYYPYQGAEGRALDADFDFYIEADQSVAGNYQKSDFIAGGTSKSPSADPVLLSLGHRFSKVVINVTNNIAGETVKSVALGQLPVKAVLNLAKGAENDPTAIVPDETTKTAIVANPVAAGSYEMIVFPQANVQPDLVVTMTNNKTYTFKLAAAVNFSMGKKATANIVLNKDEGGTGTAAAFSFSVADWEDDAALVFGENPVEGSAKEDNKWAVVGLNGDWDNDIYMTLGEDANHNPEWSVTITYDPATTQAIKFRYNNSWDENFGAATENELLNVKTDITLYSGGQNFKINVDAATQMTFYFRPSDGHLWIDATVASNVDPNASADLYVINGPGWANPTLWAWGGSGNIAMPGGWPNGFAPEAGTVTIGGKEYIHFVLDYNFIGTVGFLIVNNQETPAPQTVNADNVVINDGDKLYYEVGTVPDGTGMYPLNPVQ